MDEDVQFAKVKDFEADNKKQFFNEVCEVDAEKTINRLPKNTNLLVEGVFDPAFKIKRVTPITSNYIKNVLTI